MKRRLGKILFVALIMISVVIFWSTRPGKQTLLAASRQIPLPAGLEPISCGWLNDHEMLYASTDATGRNSLTRVDSANGTTTSIFPSKLQFDANLRTNFFQPRLSPNGKWLLWPESTGKLWVAATLDGARRSTWPRGQGPSWASRAAWLSDSRRWMEVVEGKNGPGVAIHSLGSAVVQQIRIPGSVRQINAVLGASSDGKLIFLDGTMRAGTMRFATADSNSAAPAFLAGSILSSAHQTVEEAALSPQGDRIAWKIRTGGNDLLAQSTAWSDFKWNIGWVPLTRISLYVSNTHGSNMRELGYIVVRQNDVGFQVLRWEPGGNKISYFVGTGGRLFEVPVPR